MNCSYAIWMESHAVSIWFVGLKCNFLGIYNSATITQLDRVTMKKPILQKLKIFNFK